MSRFFVNIKVKKKLVIFIRSSILKLIGKNRIIRKKDEWFLVRFNKIWIMFVWIN